MDASCVRVLHDFGNLSPNAVEAAEVLGLEVAEQVGQGVGARCEVLLFDDDSLDGVLLGQLGATHQVI